MSRTNPLWAETNNRKMFFFVVFFFRFRVVYIFIYYFTPMIVNLFDFQTHYTISNDALLECDVRIRIIEHVHGEK